MTLFILFVAIFGIVLFLIATRKTHLLLQPVQISKAITYRSTSTAKLRLFSKPFPAVLMSCAMMLTIPPLLQYWETASFGSLAFQWLEMVHLLTIGLAIPISFLSLFLVWFRRCRTFALRTLIATGVLWLASAIGYPIAAHIRMAAFHRLAERSQSLVDAVRNYEAVHGKAPPELNALVPQFLPSIPNTGMGAYPNYEYHVGEEAALHYEGNPWCLVVSTPRIGINFDKFLYLPLGNYPATGYGGFLERVRDWAYVWE